MPKKADQILLDAQKIMQEHGWTSEQELSKAIMMARRNAEASSIRALKPTIRFHVYRPGKQ